MLQIWFVLLVLGFFAAFVRGLFFKGPDEHDEAWGFGANYGGPDFGIPAGWPSTPTKH